jgi:hypothetical protein
MLSYDSEQIRSGSKTPSDKPLLGLASKDLKGHPIILLSREKLSNIYIPLLQ